MAARPLTRAEMLKVGSWLRSVAAEFELAAKEIDATNHRAAMEHLQRGTSSYTDLCKFMKEAALA